MTHNTTRGKAFFAEPRAADLRAGCRRKREYPIARLDAGQSVAKTFVLFYFDRPHERKAARAQVN
jgi:hypothetical protein